VYSRPVKEEEEEEQSKIENKSGVRVEDEKTENEVEERGM